MMLKLFFAVVLFHLPLLTHAQWRAWGGGGYSMPSETVKSEHWYALNPNDDAFDANNVSPGHGFVIEAGMHRDLGRWFTIRPSLGFYWRRMTETAGGSFRYGSPDSLGRMPTIRYEAPYEFRRAEMMLGLNISFVAVRTKRFGCGVSGVVHGGLSLIDRFRFRDPNAMNTAIAAETTDDFTPYNSDWHHFSSPPDLAMLLGVGLFFAYDLTDRLRIRLDGHAGSMGILGQEFESQVYGGGHFHIMPSLNYTIGNGQ